MRWIWWAAFLGSGTAIFWGCSSSRAAAEPDSPPQVRKALWDAEGGEARTADSLWAPFARALQRTEKVRVELSERPPESEERKRHPSHPHGEGRHHGGGGPPGMGPGGFGPSAEGEGMERSPGTEARPSGTPSVEFGIAATLERWDLRDSLDTSAVDTARLSLRLIFPTSGRMAWRSTYGCSSPSRDRIRPERGPVRPACLDTLLDRAAREAADRAVDVAHRLRHPDEAS